MVESSQLPEGTVRLPPERIAEFSAAVFRACGVDEAGAELAAAVLLAADLRGIRSHGVARLQYFAVRLERGVINPSPNMRLETRTDTTAALHADNGIGIIAADLAMREALAMAEAHGSGFVTVTRSNHFGFAGYWAGVARARGFVGIALSNSGKRVAPTFGTESLLGTNPIAIAIPGGPGGTDFFLDMGTSVVSAGKVETALREGRPIPDGWVLEDEAPPALDDKGILTHDAVLLPLGGAGDETGGHKGYGLALLVELLCGALAGSPLEARIAAADGSAPAEIGHFLGALRVDGFRSAESVHTDMAGTFDTLRDSRKVAEGEHIYIHGEPEAMAEVENRRLGIPVTPKLLHQMRALDDRYRLGFGL